MRMMLNRRASRTFHSVVGVCGIILALVGCAGTGGGAGTSAPTASPTSGSRTYSSTSFLTPFDVTLPAWLPRTPTTSHSNFVTWEASDGIRKVRVLEPVAVYLPGKTTSSAVPADFTVYLLGLAGSGALITDTETTTVAGHPAVIMTIAGPTALDGVLGCEKAAETASDCFGVQPELSLRLASIDVSGTPLLVWLRTDANYAGNPAAGLSFATMLASLKLVDRAVTP